MYTVEADIAANVEVAYRYFIGTFDATSPIPKVGVRKWETHLEPRKIPRGDEQLTRGLDTFGIIEGVEKVDRGWLSYETLFQFKFYNNPFILSEKFREKSVLVKVRLKV